MATHQEKNPAERDAKIRRLVAAGVTAAQVAKRLNLSIANAYFLVRRAKLWIAMRQMESRKPA